MAIGSTRSTAAEHLDTGDLVDLEPALRDPRLDPWVWAPFGTSESSRRAAVEAALIDAESQYAFIEAVEPSQDGTIVVYNDQINITVPAGYPFTVFEPGN